MKDQLSGNDCCRGIRCASMLGSNLLPRLHMAIGQFCPHTILLVNPETVLHVAALLVSLLILMVDLCCGIDKLVVQVL